MAFMGSARRYGLLATIVVMSAFLIAGVILQMLSPISPSTLRFDPVQRIIDDYSAAEQALRMRSRIP